MMYRWLKILILFVCCTTFLFSKEKIILLGGKSFHGRGVHDCKTSCSLLKESFEEILKNDVEVIIIETMPKDLDFYKDAKLFVIMGEGGDSNPLSGNEEILKKVNEAGTNIAVLHYALVMPKVNEFDKYLIDSIGGCYEKYFTVNPRWTAELRDFAKHPATNGVKPFKIYDEWYFHFRLRDDGVTHLARSIPQDEEIFKRPDGMYTGNKHVRENRGNPETLVWVCENKNGTRGFGFSGWDMVFNYNNDNFRKLIINSLLWTMGHEVPKNGFETRRPTIDEIDALSLKLEGKKIPKNWERKFANWKKLESEWNK